ncbi:unnamed protein product, partial [Rotaria magnacalcarata]
PGLTPPSSQPPPGTRIRREPDGPVSLKLDADTNLHVPSPFRVGAITADRRGIEPDTYVFQVPEHEESPLGPLTLTSRRGNLRDEISLRSRDPTDSSYVNNHQASFHRRSILARIFATRKNDSQESALVKDSTNTEESNHPRTAHDLLLARTINQTGSQYPHPDTSITQQHPAVASTHMYNANHEYQDQIRARPYGMQLRTRGEVEDLVNACLDTSGIDRRYNALILEELRDCTNLTHDQLRQAAHEITAHLGSNSPQSASFTSSVYDSAATNIPSSDEHLYDSSDYYKKV